MRVIGTHAGCGGNILYYSTSGEGYRECEKCGADGKFGRPSPNTEEEVRRWALKDAETCSTEELEAAEAILERECQGPETCGVCHVCQRRHEWRECDGA